MNSYELGVKYPKNAMNKYIIHINEFRDEPNASSKARNDIEQIAKQNGFTSFDFTTCGSAKGKRATQIRMLVTYEQDWRKLYKNTEYGSIVLVQYPLFPLKLTFLAKHWMKRIRAKKQITFVALIHDLDSIRKRYGEAAKYADSHFLPEFDRIICHNDRMKDYLVQQGIPEEKQIQLGLFDYLTDAKPQEHHLQDGIAIAGNLSPEKSGYIEKLIRINNGSIPIHLYGDGIQSTEGAIYHGTFPPNELPGEMEGAFGLVWDGQLTDKCAGSSGEYLLYNSPHKTSLYISSGMPVIAWNQAAITKKITDNEIGREVDALENLLSVITAVTEDQYAEMKHKTETLREDIIHGQLLSTILKSIIEEKEQK